MFAGIAYAAYFGWATSGKGDLETGSAGMAWMCCEFGLSQSEKDEIAHLQESYRPRCEKQCLELAAARTKLVEMTQKADDVDALKAAYDTVCRCEQRCFELALEQVDQICSIMQPSKSDDFRERILLRLVDQRTDKRRMFQIP